VPSFTWNLQKVLKSVGFGSEREVYCTQNQDLFDGDDGDFDQNKVDEVSS
jgi:hypothetical protein